MLSTTGTRYISQNDEHVYVTYLSSPEMHLYLMRFDGFMSGACIGWDSIFGSTMALKYPDKEHIVIVPADRSRVESWWEKFDLGYVKVVYMPDGTSYRDRNVELVRQSQHQFFCADYPEDHGKSVRSGTWQTVRFAREAHELPPDGIIIHNESDGDTNE